MLNRCTINDLSKIDAILKDDDVYPFMIDDYSGAAIDFSAKPYLENKHCHVLMPNDYTAILAYPINGVMYDLHLAVLKPGRGEMAVEAVKRTIKEYLFEKTECRKIIIFVPGFNHKMAKFAAKIGARLEGTIKNSFLKDGELHHQMLFGIEKEQ